jgi:hypothetical protein
MWLGKLRVLALGATLGLAACAPVGSGGLVLGAAPVGPGWASPGWQAGPGWHGGGRGWRHDPFWHSRPVGGWGPRPYHRGWHDRGWHHGGWNRGGWHGGHRGGWPAGPRHRW